MRKMILLAVVLSITALFFGCGAKPAGNTISEKSTVGKCLEGSPEWVLAGGTVGGLTAVGAAPVGKAGINFARTEALASGRDEVARILQVKVNNMFKSFTQSTGVGDAETVDKVAANVSKQVASVFLSGSKQVGSWVSPCNEFYILVGVDSALAQKAVKDQAMSSFQNDQALWQQFQAKKGQDELDLALTKEFGPNSAPVVSNAVPQAK